MFTPKFIRENTTRLGRGRIIETSGEVTDNVEIFSGSDNTMLVALRQYAAINPEDAREDVVVFPVVNLRRFEITSQD